MNDDLFAMAGAPVPETLSPRMAWMREHDIHVEELPEENRVEPEDLWIAWQGESGPNSPAQFGESRDEALLRLAKDLGIKPWAGGAA